MGRVLMTVLVVVFPLLVPRLLGQAALPDAGIRFVDVAAPAGLTLLNVHGGPAKDYILDASGNGAALFDYDNDEDLDVVLVNGSTREHLASGGDPILALYENDGSGRFTDTTAASGLDRRRGWGMGACVADIDNDGFHDLYVTAYGPNALFHNDGDGTFTDVTGAAGVGDPRWGANCAFADYDRDGDVDLYVANYVAFDEDTTPEPGAMATCRFQRLDVFCGPLGLPGQSDVLYRNEGDGTFTDVTDRAGIDDPGYYGFGVIFSDLDGDGWPDIFVANDSVPNLLFRNDRDGTFTESAVPAGVAFSASGAPQAGMGAAAGDYDNDGDLDLVVTNFADEYNTVYENTGADVFLDVTHVAGLAVAPLRYLAWGVGFVDVDNDGLRDLFVANGHVWPGVDDLERGPRFAQRNQLFRNQGHARFTDVTGTAGAGLQIEKSSRGAAFGDYDNDGDVDVLVVNLNDRPTLLRNDTRTDHHWVTIRVVGGAGGEGPRGRAASNRDAIGARITVEAGGRVEMAEVHSGGSYLSQDALRVHFGLGDADRVERLEIRWPDGLVDTRTNLEADRFYTIREGDGPVPRG